MKMDNFFQENKIEKNVEILLLKYRAISFNTEKPFRYASGIISPIYCDNRILLTYPESREFIVDSFLDVIKKNDLAYDSIGGVATAGIAWGVLIAERLNKNFIYIRAEKKDHGKQNAIEGKLEAGQKVLIIDDLISTGQSSIKAIENVRSQGGIVDDCLGIFSYDMKQSKDNFANILARTYALSNLSKLIDKAMHINYIDETQKEIILEWTKDTTQWAKVYGLKY